MKTKGSLLKTFKEYAILTAATVLLDIGIYFFKFPNNFSFGGVSGISVVLSKFISISPSTINLILNMLLLIVGFIFLGRDFAVKTVYVSTLSAVLMYVMEFVVPMTSPFSSQPVLELIFAILLPAVAAAIFFNFGASSGGTDIIAMILKNRASMDIGIAMLIVNALIAVSTFFVFDIQTGLFSVCGLLSHSLIVNNVIENINTFKYFNVICDNPEPICDFICNKLGRSATVYSAEGAYTHAQKTVVLTAMRRGQAVQLRKFIKDTEPTAFILISTTSEIIGKGFGGFN